MSYALAKLQVTPTKKVLKCKFCGWPIYWKKSKGKWIPMDIARKTFHRCDRRKI